MKVSILMITYNHEKYIHDAITSVINQNVNFPIELVIGDDCSTDNTSTIVRDFQNKFPNLIKVIDSQKNVGMLQNFSRTFNACTGEYIAVLEGDDFWFSENKLSQQVSLLDNNPTAAICHSNALILDELNDSKQRHFHNIQSRISNLEDLLSRNIICTPSVMYRSGIVNNFPDWYFEQGMGDWSCHFLHALCGNILYIDEPLAAYRIHPGGVWSSQKRETQLINTINLLNCFNVQLEYQYDQKIKRSILSYQSELEDIKNKTSIITTKAQQSINQNLDTLNHSSKHKLHIGCGNNHFVGWINIDIEADNPNADLITDICQPLPFPDQSCQFIYSEHVLEHLSIEEGSSFIHECFRVLEPGGIIRVAMPSLEYLVDKYQSQDWREQEWLKWQEYKFIKTPAEMLNIAFRWWGHQWLYDSEELTRRLENASFTDIREMKWGHSDIVELSNLETRPDSFLIFEAEVPKTNVETPLVSICIPTYNGEDFIEDALVSAINQSYQNIEILISDDNSSDNTISIIQKYQNNRHPIKIFEHDSLGLVENWNFCIKHAQGKYIKFLFQDDLLENTCVERMVGLAEEDEKIGLVFSARHVVASENNESSLKNLLKHEASNVHKAWTSLERIQEGKTLLKQGNILDFPINKIGEPSTVLLRKSIFDRIGYFQPNLAQLVDLEMWYRVMSKYQIGFIDEYLSSFRVHENQETQKNIKRKNVLLNDYLEFYNSIKANLDYPDRLREKCILNLSFLSYDSKSFYIARKLLADIWIKVEEIDVQSLYYEHFGHSHNHLLSLSTKYCDIDQSSKRFFEQLENEIMLSDDGKLNASLLLAASLYKKEYLSFEYLKKLSTNSTWLITEEVKNTFKAPPFFREVGESKLYFSRIKDSLSFWHQKITSKNTPEIVKFAITDAIVKNINFIPLYFNQENVLQLQQQRSEVLGQFLSFKGLNPIKKNYIANNNSEKIRIGILAQHFTPSAETYATLPIYEYLSKDYEVILYSLTRTEHPLEQYCRSCASHFKVLSHALTQQIVEIESDNLNILFFATNITAVTNPIALLANYRMAEIQITSVGSVITTGMPCIDYYISGSLTDDSEDAQSHYSEKLIHLNGEAHCFSYGNEEQIRTVDYKTINRKQLGISIDQTVYVSGANFYKLIPELIHAWSKILASTPDSILLLLPFGPNWSSSYPTSDFVSHIELILAGYKVEKSRLIVLDPNPTPNRIDLLSIYKIADVYLDSFPFSGTTSLIEPLQLGLPVISQKGKTFRSSMGSALLEALSIPELVAKDTEEYISLACQLGLSLDKRENFQYRIKSGMNNKPSFLDSKTYAQKICKVFQTLYEKAQNQNLKLKYNLQDENILLVPDWSLTEGRLETSFLNSFKALSSLDRESITVLIPLEDYLAEEIQLFMSGIAMSLFIDEDIDISDKFEVSYIENLSQPQLAFLLNQLTGKLLLGPKSYSSTFGISAYNVPAIQADL